MPGVNCGAFESSLVELARRGAVDAAERVVLLAHLDDCQPCRRVFDAQVRLSEAARVLATEAANYSAPPRVERALLAELGSVRPLPRRRFAYPVFAGAIAASLALVFWLTSRTAEKPAVPDNTPVAQESVPDAQPRETVLVSADQPVRPVKKPKRAALAENTQQPEESFFAIPYAMPLEPYERASLIRMDLPVSALIAAGVPTSLMDPGTRAQTDVLVGQDGRPRAVRLVSISTLN